ncbi:putative nuclease HARBI1 isoform X2 [Haliotis rubra]|nr:putative nuclease HARBI1 isoform X2 [Haliotis rubra]
MAAVALRRRSFHQRRQSLVEYSDEELIRRYRPDGNGIRFVASLIAPDVEPTTTCNHALDASQKTLITLRYLRKFQLCNADDQGVSQPTISRAVNDCIRSLSSDRIVKHFVRFPLQLRDIRRHQTNFYQVANFPGVVGVIDGMHVQIQAPTVNENEFVNRHHYHSINTQIAFDSEDRIIDVVARWPGSAHDSRILTNSGLYQLFDHNVVPIGCHLLGDSGYPCKKWLLTPFLRPLAGPQTNYNRSHKRTRSSVERAIGQFKRRFPVLHGEIRLKPEKACKVIIAYAVLHNICKDRNIPIPPTDGHDGFGRHDGQNGGLPGITTPVAALRCREHFANTNFP